MSLLFPFFLSGQTVTLSKTVSNATPNVEETFNYILDVACSSTTGPCKKIVIRDTIPNYLEFLNFSSPLPSGVASATYDVVTREAVITMDMNTSAGSSIQILMQVQFPHGTLTGSQAINTAYATSTNAGSANSTATATAQNGVASGDFPDHKWGDGSQITGGYQYWSIEVGNIGFTDIDNYTVIDTLPSGIILDQVRSPYFTDVNHNGDIYYMRSDNPGVWVFWYNFNMNFRDTRYVSNLSLPSGVHITQLKLELGTVSANGSFNPYIYPSSFERSWVLYGVETGSRMVGDTYTNCAYYTGTSGGTPISDVDCTTTHVIAPTNEVTGGVLSLNLSEIEQTTFSLEDTMIVGLQYASPSLMGYNLVGGVLTAILPPNVSYVPGSWYFQWGSSTADGHNPAIETGVTLDGRDIVRFVFDSTTYNNAFSIEPNGGWDGFRLDFKTFIEPSAIEGVYDIEYYYNATEMVPDNCGNNDTHNYLNGFASTYCDDIISVNIVRPPGAAGLQSRMEVIGTLDTDYSQYPDRALTVPGGISDYRITIKNPNASRIDKLVFITVLPHIGDTEVLDSSTPRNSDWKPTLAEPVVTGIPQLDVEYSTIDNPCRNELAGGNPTPFPTGCNTPNWSSTPPADITDVTALLFDYGNTKLDQNDSLVVSFSMRSPVDALPDTSIAWNSFAYAARNFSSGSDLLPAEPIKVGIELRPGNFPIVGDYVWHDSIANGVQDASENGIDGVRVELYHDVDNDNIPEPGGPDTLELWTVTSSGGKYLFSDFEYGRYFIAFSDLPVGYNPTYQDATTDDKDSDGLVTDIMLFDNTVETYDIDLGLYNGTLPELCSNGTDDDGDGLVDCLDPDCDRISLSNTIGSCIDHPLEDIAQLSVEVSWTTPLDDTLEILVAGSSHVILMDTATSPITIAFNVPADGSIDNIITASWGFYNSGCSEIDSFDAPIACSMDSISCNILYFCGDEKPSDGDAWDHGWIDYLDTNNGTSIVDAIYTKDEPGQGTYDPINQATFVNVDYSKYDLIIVSASTEDHISSDLVDVLKGLSQSIILSNFEEVTAFDLSSTAGSYKFDEDLYIDNSNTTKIYNYRNSINPLFNNVFTHLDYRSDADAYLWNDAGAKIAENQGVYVYYEKFDVFPNIAVHGPRTYFGFHMNQLYANQRNGGPVPASTQSWFHPTKDLSTAGKIFFDQMIIEAASECGLHCQIATLNPHIMYHQKSN